MENNALLAVRSNCNFSLNYETNALTPQAEVILIVTQPKYEINKQKTAFSREAEVKDIRFHAGLPEINKLIGELQLLVKNMNTFEQMAGSLNAIIESAKPKE